MTRKITPKAQSHTLKMLFATVLIALATLTALAQVTGAGRSKESADAVTRASQKRGAKPLDTNPPVFLPAMIYSSGGGETDSVAVADINGDGKPDILLANFTSDSVSVLLSNGDGTFQTAATYGSGGLNPDSVVIADVNGDGKPDIVVANLNFASVGVLLGNGDGTFRPAVTYGAGMRAMSVAVADVNGDGKPDLLVANQDGNAGVLLGNGDGTFQTVVTYGAGGAGSSSVAVADVNGDGKPDLVVANYFSNSVGVLLGNGDGTFQTAATYGSGGLNPDSVAIADVNGDGKPDIVVANYFSSVGVLLGNGDGTFQTAVTYSSGSLGVIGPVSVAVADVNGDGKPDLLVANIFADWPNNENGTVGVLLGNGDGTFQPAVTYNSGGTFAESVAVADVNGDGKPDLLVANGSGSVGVLLNNTPFCTTPLVITVSTTPTALWPPNGNMIPVTVSGTITDTGCTVTNAAYAVTDEYGQVQPSGPVTLGPGGAYSFTVLLQASRLGNDLDGRLYTITVSASNNAGETRSQAGPVIVPHDQGR
jgi:hypothetical protein